MCSIFPSLFKLTTNFNLFQYTAAATPSQAPAATATAALTPQSTPAPHPARKTKPKPKVAVRYSVATRVKARNQKKRLVARLQSARKHHRALRQQAMSQYGGNDPFSNWALSFGTGSTDQDGIGHRVAAKNQEKRMVVDQGLRVAEAEGVFGSVGGSVGGKGGDMSVGKRVAAKNAAKRIGGN